MPAARLTLADVSAVIRLVVGVCDRWDDPPAWREHLLQGACKLMRGNVGMMVADAGRRDNRFERPRVVSVFGVPDAQRALVQPAMARLDGQGYADASTSIMPGLSELHADIVRQGWVTVRRDQTTDPVRYHAAPHYTDFLRHLDCDDYVASIRIVDVPRRPEAIAINRPHGARPFGNREVAILKLLHDEIAPLVGVRLATEAHLSRGGLSRRLRQTLNLLLEGLSEKQVAAALRLAPRTVHEYVTALYAHFEVTSRAELLAYFIRRQPRQAARARPAARAVRTATRP